MYYIIILYLYSSIHVDFNVPRVWGQNSQKKNTLERETLACDLWQRFGQKPSKTCLTLNAKDQSIALAATSKSL